MRLRRITPRRGFRLIDIRHNNPCPTMPRRGFRLIKHGKHIQSNIYTLGFRCEIPRCRYRQIVAGAPIPIHCCPSGKPRPQSLCHRRHVRPHTHTCQPISQTGHIRVGDGGQTGHNTMDKGERSCQMQICMAGRIWGFFLWEISGRQCCKLYQKPRTTSWETHIP